MPRDVDIKTDEEKSHREIRRNRDKKRELQRKREATLDMQRDRKRQRTTDRN